MNLVATFDWSGLGTGLAIAFIAFMQMWQQRQQNRMGRTVDTIHTLTNSKMGEELFSGWVSAKALMAVQPTPENIALCTVAEKKYLDHQMRQAKVDEVGKPKENKADQK